jgi:hypothetical protein
MKLHDAIISLPDSLINKIYLYLPNHTLFALSKTNFNLYIDDYYKHCKQTKRGVFYYSKVNNTYIRYLIRNNLYLFMDYMLHTSANIPFKKIKKFYYNNKMFKTYIDYCIFLANLYESETTKQVLMDYKKSNKI